MDDELRKRGTSPCPLWLQTTRSAMGFDPAVMPSERTAGRGLTRPAVDKNYLSKKCSSRNQIVAIALPSMVSS
jgi:hypothetical protein